LLDAMRVCFQAMREFILLVAHEKIVVAEGEDSKRLLIDHRDMIGISSGTLDAIKLTSGDRIVLDDGHFLVARIPKPSPPVVRARKPTALE